MLEFVDSGLIALVLVFLVLRPFVVQAFYIPSGSMRPTLLENDKILVSKFTYRFRRPSRGDVIVFKAPPQADPTEKDFIKRVVGLPGDVIEVQDGIVYLNGEAQSEPYVAEPPAYTMPPVLVEPGKVFVMGDNRNDSNDSHAWGQLDERRIRGKALLIFWPPARIGLIR
ncbi:MAG: signal peptidase I [Armatimonadota bacterium]|nr:signal peptidase I [Armatimonadota bacterium]